LNKEELMHWLASQVGVDKIPDDVRAILEEDGWVEDALDNHTGMERQDLVDETLALVAEKPGRIDAEEPGSVDVLAYEANRAAVYAEYLAKIAVEDERVQGFRRHVLEDKLLTPEAAEKYLEAASDYVHRKLTRIARRLARIYPWEPEDAAWFVITGHVPPVMPVRARTRTRYTHGFSSGTIVLEVAPWVSAETVQKTYIEAQTKLRGRRAHKLEDRNLAVFRFVVERLEAVRPVTLTKLRETHTPRSLKFLTMDEFGWPKMFKATELVGPPLTELHGEWNQKYPEGHDWHYKSPKTFTRDFRKTQEEISHPLYNPKNRVDPGGS
jgi:hypothetical protein